MVRKQRAFREWQHPRDERGRFSRRGGGGFNVVQEMPWPEHFGDPEDWR